MSDIKITHSLQDYLEAILDLSHIDDEVRITDIAEQLNIAKPSVNEAVNILVNLGLVTHRRYGPVVLTSKGKTEALNIRNVHDILASFMRDTLGVDAEVAEQDACRMEHVVSPQTIQRLVEYTQTEKNRQPIGNESRSANNKNKAEGKGRENTPVGNLNQLTPGQRARVVKIDGGGAIKRRIMDMGVLPGVNLEMERYAPLGDPVEIKINGFHLSLRRIEAEKILIEKEGEQCEQCE
jgi:DtxR family Mn-dependent transcriptional regulator